MTPNPQSRVTVYYSETSRFEQLSMTHLGQITYPQVFNQKTATHVVMAVVYGDQAFSKVKARRKLRDNYMLWSRKSLFFPLRDKELYK